MRDQALTNYCAQQFDAYADRINFLQQAEELYRLALQTLISVGEVDRNRLAQKYIEYKYENTPAIKPYDERVRSLHLSILNHKRLQYYTDLLQSIAGCDFALDTNVQHLQANYLDVLQAAHAEGIDCQSVLTDNQKKTIDTAKTQSLVAQFNIKRADYIREVNSYISVQQITKYVWQTGFRCW